MDPADNSSEMSKVWRTHNLNRAAGVLKNSMGGSLKRGGLILKQAMQKRAPVWTGRMTRSTSLGPVVSKDGAYTLLVGPTVEYAKYPELEPWISGKRPGHADALLLTSRQVPRKAASVGRRIQLDERQHLLRASRTASGRPTQEPRDNGDVLLDRHVGKEPDPLKHVSDGAAER